MNPSAVTWNGLDSPDSISEEDVFLFPASPAQRRFWKLDSPDPGNPIYNVAVRFALEGAVDRSLLERSFHSLIAHHEALRTYFLKRENDVFQVVLPAFPIEVPLVDLCNVRPDQREEELERISLSSAQYRFCLATGPLLQVTLLRVAQQSFVLLVNAHHSVYDGWSVGVMTAELACFYQGFASGVPPRLEPLPVQYPDYAIWQREWAAGPAALRQLQFWIRQLRALDPGVPKSDFARRLTSSRQADIVSAVLPRVLTDELERLSLREGNTFFVTVLAAFAAFLRPYMESSEFPVGTQVAGRHQVEVEKLIGCFSNTLVLRCDTSGDPTFLELLKRVEEMTLQSIAHQEVPFELVANALQPTPGAAADSLFHVNFICQRDFVRPVHFAGIELAAIPSKSQGALYDLNFFLVERADGWRLSCEYRTDLFEESTVSGMLGEYRELLEQVIQEPARPLSECQNGTPTGTGETHHAASYPASVAQQRFWTLHEATDGQTALNLSGALQLTGSLQIDALEKAVQAVVDRHEILRTSFAFREDQVVQIIAPSCSITIPVLTPPSLDLAIAEEANYRFDLQSQPLLRTALFSGGSGDYVLTITMPHIVCDGWSFGIFTRELRRFYEAFSLYRSLVLPVLKQQYSDFVLLQRLWVNSEEAARHLAFWQERLSGQELLLDLPTDFPPTSCAAAPGGNETLLLRSSLSDALRTFALQEEVTLFTILLSTFQMLLARYANNPYVLVGSPSANRVPDTESLIGLFSNPVCLFTDLSGNPTFRKVFQKAGKENWEALAHAELPFEILREHLHVRQVRNRTPLFQFYFYFQKAFLEPFSMGDVTASPLPAANGTALFELQLAVIERPEGLRAHLEYNRSLFRPETIRSILADYQDVLEQALANPDALLDTAAVSTQFNCAAIQTPEQPPERVQVAEAPPRPPNALELQLLSIWKAALKLKDIRLTDNFFELGGHSLMAARLFTAIRKQTGRNLPLVTLFQAPTVEKLARVMMDEGWLPPWGALVPIQPEGTASPLFLIHPIGGNVLTYRSLSQHMAKDQPVYGVQAQGLDGKNPPHLTIEQMAADYIQKVQAVQPNGPYRLGGFSAGGIVAFEMAKQLEAQGEITELLALLDTSAEDWGYSHTIASRNPVRARALRVMLSENRRFVSHFGLRLFLLAKSRNLGLRAHLMQHKLNRLNPFPRTRRPSRSSVQVEAAFLIALKAYRPKSYAGKAVLFRTASQGFDNPSHDMGWGSSILGGVEILIVDGDHNTVFLEPNLETLAGHLNRAIRNLPLRTA